MKSTREVAEAAYILLEAIAAASDAFPSLKSVSAGALHVIKLAKSFKSNKKEWAAFADHLQVQTALMIRALPNGPSPPSNLESRIMHLKHVLDAIATRIVELQDQSGIKRVFTFAKDPAEIDALRRQLAEGFQTFHLENAIDNSRVLESLTSVTAADPVKMLLDKTDRKIDKIATSTALKDLLYADSASWQPELACLEGTRTKLLNDVLSWVHDESENSARCMLLTDAPGSGKSAFAHTVAMICHKQGILGSSFFFSRNTSGRSSAERVIGTIVRDLSSKDPQYSPTPRSGSEPHFDRIATSTTR